MNTSNETTSPSTTPTTSADTSLESPRVSLTEKDPTEMTDEELNEYVRQIRLRRTSQQLANENKPRRPSKKAVEESPSNRAKMEAELKGLLDDDSE